MYMGDTEILVDVLVHAGALDFKRFDITNTPDFLSQSWNFIGDLTEYAQPKALEANLAIPPDITVVPGTLSTPDRSLWETRAPEWMQVFFDNKRVKITRNVLDYHGEKDDSANYLIQSLDFNRSLEIRYLGGVLEYVQMIRSEKSQNGDTAERTVTMNLKEIQDTRTMIELHKDQLTDDMFYPSVAQTVTYIRENRPTELYEVPASFSQTTTLRNKYTHVADSGKSPIILEDLNTGTTIKRRFPFDTSLAKESYPKLLQTMKPATQPPPVPTP
jgi:hypothetical protein